MKIILQNFRHYRGIPKVFEFEPGQVTLLQGKSGQGKSTILLAILWCLYGGLRGNALKPIPVDEDNLTKKRKATATSYEPLSSSVHNPQDIKDAAEALRLFSVGKSATAVIMYMQEIGAIIRRKAAATSTLEIEFIESKELLSGGAATAWIESIFGSKNLWVSSSYIAQGGRNPLLSLTNAEKFALLYELTFGSPLPGEVADHEETVPQTVISAANTEETSPAPFVRIASAALNRVRNKARSAAVKAAGARDALEDAYKRISCKVTDNKVLSSSYANKDVEKKKILKSVHEIDSLISKYTSDIDHLKASIANSKYHEDKRLSLQAILDSAEKMLFNAENEYETAVNAFKGSTNVRNTESSNISLLEERVNEIRLKERNKERALANENLIRKELNLAKEALISAQDKCDRLQSKINQIKCDVPTQEQVAVLEKFISARNNFVNSPERNVMVPITDSIIQTAESLKIIWSALNSIVKNGEDKLFLDACLSRLGEMTKIGDVMSLIKTEIISFVVDDLERRNKLYNHALKTYKKFSKLTGHKMTNGEQLPDLEDLREFLVELETHVSLREDANNRFSCLSTECTKCGNQVNFADCAQLAIVPKENISSSLDLKLSLLAGKEAIQLGRKLEKYFQDIIKIEDDLGEEAIEDANDLEYTHGGELIEYLFTATTKSKDVYSLYQKFCAIECDEDKEFNTLQALKLLRGISSLSQLSLAITEARDVLSKSQELKISCDDDEAASKLESLRKTLTEYSITKALYESAKNDVTTCRDAEERIESKLQNIIAESQKLSPFDTDELIKVEKDLEAAREKELERTKLQAEFNASSKRVREIKQQITDIKTALASIPTTSASDESRAKNTNKIEEIEREILALKNERQDASALSELDHFRNNYDAALLAEKETSQKLALATEAVRTVAEAAICAISDTVNAISMAANAVLANVFCEISGDSRYYSPMSISLELTHKGAVTSLSAGNAVNLLVTYRSTTYEGAQLLSGGETDRLSFALTVALARAARSPIVLLDECFSSLDDATQDLCFAALRKYLPGKTIINICHSSIAGLHDRQVDVYN